MEQPQLMPSQEDEATFQKLYKNFQEKTEIYLKKEAELVSQGNGFGDMVKAIAHLQARQEYLLAEQEYGDFLDYINTKYFSF